MKCARMYWFDKTLSLKEKVSKCEKIIDIFTEARKETKESFLVVFEKSIIEQFIYLMAAHKGKTDDIVRFLDKFLCSAEAETEIIKTDNALKDGILLPYKTENTLSYHINNWKNSSHWSIARLRENKKIKSILNKWELKIK